jgi:DNA-binding transcriptional ArsR family regulator
MPRRNGNGIALLADETRRRIISLLAMHPMRPSAVAQAIGLSRPATSRQLHLLLAAGLVRSFYSPIDRRSVLYAIEPLARGPIIAWLAGTEVALPDSITGPATPRRASAAEIAAAVAVSDTAPPVPWLGAAPVPEVVLPAGIDEETYLDLLLDGSA